MSKDIQELYADLDRADRALNEMSFATALAIVGGVTTVLGVMSDAMEAKEREKLEKRVRDLKAKAKKFIAKKKKQAQSGEIVDMKENTKKLLDQITTDRVSDAGNTFKRIIQSKIADRLDQERQIVAKEAFGITPLRPGNRLNQNSTIEYLNKLGQRFADDFTMIQEPEQKTQRGEGPPFPGMHDFGGGIKQDYHEAKMVLKSKQKMNLQHAIELVQEKVSGRLRVYGDTSAHLESQKYFGGFLKIKKDIVDVSIRPDEDGHMIVQFIIEPGNSMVPDAKFSLPNAR